MSLVGKFIFVDSGEHYKTGEVAEAITPELYLIKVDSFDPKAPPSSILLHASYMVGHDDEQGFCCFFNSRLEMQDWLAWLETPAEEPKKPKLVKFKLKADK
jgi:hypothetical protein